MNHKLTRRDVLSAGAIGAAASLAPPTYGAETQPAGETSIEALPLGRTGVKVTRLGMGASFPEYGERVLNFAFKSGIRYFDNAQGYLRGKTQQAVGEWVKNQNVRKDVFLVTKTYATDPARAYQSVVSSLKQMQLETIDLFMLHGIDSPDLPLDASGEWKKLKERLQSEGKVRFMGFSTHTDMERRTECLLNAPKGGWVDALMVACDPGLIKADPKFDKALDVCAKAGVGLVAMKTTRGLGKAEAQPQNARDAFKPLGVGPHVAMLQGMWSDARFACIVSEMPSLQILDENASAARAFRKPLGDEQRKVLHEGIQKLSRATCPGCDGSCQVAAGARTDFCSIARFVAYHDEDGKRQRARELFAALPKEARSWADADLSAASRACRGGLDFERILARARQVLG